MKHPICTIHADRLALHLVVVLDIDDRLLPLASRHLTVEQDVDLTVRPALHLGQVEKGHNEAEETGATPHVAALAAKVCAL
jgi:hypothetical protein